MSLWDVVEFAATPLPVHLVAADHSAAQVADGATSVLEATERIPQGFVDFTTFPLQMMAFALDVMWWVLDHLREIFIALAAALVLVLALVLRSLAQGVNARLHEVGKGTRQRHRPQGRQPTEVHHQPNSWVDRSTICVATRADARRLAKRHGHSDVVMDHPCTKHRGSKIWAVQ